MMNEVLVIYDDNHRLIGVAKDIPSAIDYLIQEGHVSNNSEVWDYIKVDYRPIKDSLGDDWQDVLREMVYHEINELLDEYVYLEWHKVIGTD